MAHPASAARRASDPGALAAARESRGLRGHPGRAQGFTLIEMMVAVLLLGVGLMGLAALSTTVTRANVQSSALTTASALAQQRVEQLRAEPYSAIASGSDGQIVDGVTYDRSWQVSQDVPDFGLKTVVVTVSWTSRGRTHKTTLSTIRGSR